MSVTRSRAECGRRGTHLPFDFVLHTITGLFHSASRWLFELPPPPVSLWLRPFSLLHPVVSSLVRSFLSSGTNSVALSDVPPRTLFFSFFLSFSAWFLLLVLPQSCRRPAAHHPPVQPRPRLQLKDHQRGVPCVRGRGRCHQGILRRGSLRFDRVLRHLSSSRCVCCPHVCVPRQMFFWTRYEIRGLGLHGCGMFFCI